jgi:hypothetical protein
MPETALKQLNVHLDPDLVETNEGDGLVEVLEDKLQRNRRDTIALAIRALSVLMKAHEDFASQYDDDFADLYMELARRAPERFLEVPKEGVGLRREKGQAAVVVDGWSVSKDADGELWAIHAHGDGYRIGRVADDGEIRVVKVWTREQAAAVVAAEAAKN